MSVVQRRRGAKVGRLVVARMLVRSIYKILKRGRGVRRRGQRQGNGRGSRPAELKPKQDRFLKVKWIHVASSHPPFGPATDPTPVELVATFPNHHRTTDPSG